MLRGFSYREKFTMTPRAVEWKTAFDHWQKTDYDDDQDPVITSSKYSSASEWLSLILPFSFLAFREERISSFMGTATKAKPWPV